MQVAREHADAYCQQTLGYKASNMRFVQGHIELLDEAGISDESVDLVISNCVINLSPDKAQVLREAYRVLTPGGEMYFSDVYCDRRLPESVQKDEASGSFLLSQLPRSLSDEEICPEYTSCLYEISRASAQKRLPWHRYLQQALISHSSDNHHVLQSGACGCRPCGESAYQVPYTSMIS